MASWTVSNTPDAGTVDLTHTSSGSRVTLRKNSMSVYLLGDDIVFESMDTKLQIAATDVTNLVGATALLRYSDLLVTYM